MNWPGTFFSGPHALVDAYCWSKLKTRDYARFVADGNRCHVVQIIRVCFTSGRVTSGHQFLRDPWIGWWLNWTATGKSGSKKSLLIEQVVLHHLVIWLDHSWCYTEKICVSRQINTWIKWIKKHMDFSFTLLQRGFDSVWGSAIEAAIHQIPSKNREILFTSFSDPVHSETLEQWSRM